ncbi:molybdopterin synthase catalytic subunit isoform X2 [Cololabis saira]|uniref:molybdopterin synthase catalytic subunit isoform X2 n=1 Tax=Cololabis saira TaxID=129043 RepID=UPI002AD3F446|nr:molybdopterin synthase catalytic subunit isoform X2 [Cololabis saira]
MCEQQRDVFRLSHDKLSVQEVADAVNSASCGAVSMFIGTTREDMVDSKKVVGLEYEAYEPMAQSEFSRLCDDIRARWPNVKWVKVGEASVVMAISSPHRSDGQQAIQQAISQLKASVPIWKKEVYDDQDSSWKENQECCWSSHAVQTKPAV